MSQIEPQGIPSYALYGEGKGFPDVMHIERITSRAAQHDWHIAPHRHLGLHQFFLIETGTVVLRIEGEEIRPNLPVMISIPRGAVHGFDFSQGTEGYVLTVPLAELRAAFSGDTPIAPRLERWGHAEGQGFVELFSRLALEHGRADPIRPVMLRALALELCCEAARALSPVPGEKTLSRYAERMAEFEALIRLHLRKKWRLGDYAAAMRITPTQLSRISRAIVGVAASSHLEARLMQEAQRMLAYTRMPIAEVAYDLGYDDPAYFSRAFRRTTGEAPGAYRNRLNLGS